MNHIKSFENHIVENIDINFDEIQENFIKKIIESGLEPNADNAYADLELLKEYPAFSPTTG